MTMNNRKVESVIKACIALLVTLDLLAVVTYFSSEVPLKMRANRETLSSFLFDDSVKNSTLLSQFHPNRESGAYEPMVLSLVYWEQTANALKSLFSLQCWASTVNISQVTSPAVEPNNKTVLRFGLQENSFKFGELFDLHYWNSKTLRAGFSPLVSQENFLRHACRDVVYVSIGYYLSRQGCNMNEKSMTGTRWYRILKGRRFRVIKRVCIDFKKAQYHSLSESSFRKQIFEDVVASNVSVIFDKWEGLCDGSRRVAVNISRCMMGQVPPIDSPVVSTRLTDFVHQFLREYLNGERYIAIMVRTEKMFKQSINKGIRARPINATTSYTCANNIITDWNTMARQSNISRTLFFSDMGRYGSLSWTNPSSLALEFSQFIHDRLGLELTLSNVNTALEDITKSKDAVQMALLHQQLVSRATCVMMVGCGLFQRQTYRMYSSSHPGQECSVIRDRECNVELSLATTH